MEPALLESRAGTLPDGCEWHFDRREGHGRGNLLLVVGHDKGIVVASIEGNALSSWTLVLDTHREIGRQVRMMTASIAEAIDIVELWANLHKDRLLRFG